MLIPHPATLKIEDFTYHLPAERIANAPLPERSSASLLVYKNGEMRTSHYSAIAQEVPTGALMVFNDTKVVPARLLFIRPSGGQIEIFCLEPVAGYGGMAAALQQPAAVDWWCLVGGAAKWKPGQVLEKETLCNGCAVTLQATVIEKKGSSFLIHLNWKEAAITFAEILHHFGQVPLPPYIRRPADATDAVRYQTVYANEEGSVAAPTAGLHFTTSVLQSLQEKNITTGYVTLHVGAGTFKPVKAATMEGHEMHGEYFEVTETLLLQLMKHDTVIAVGTTSLRTIESLYWLGCRLQEPGNIKPGELVVQQWEPYGAPAQMPVAAALQAILDYMHSNNVNKIQARTNIIIAPGYPFKIVRGLVTNFHQPASTLLLLVAAFIGDGWRSAYEYALAHGFRFLSYGDGSLLWRQD